MKNPFYLMALVAAWVAVGCGCARDQQLSTGHLLHSYTALNNTPRNILPDEYIAYLKQTRFTNGELDHLPGGALILHSADPEPFLATLGYQTNEWQKIETGSTDPNVLYVVRPLHGKPFIINRGLPGAGGIATQTAELGALGVTNIIHIGTCAFLSDALPADILVVSAGSYKDGGALLLSDGKNGTIVPIALPDRHLTDMLESNLRAAGGAFTEAQGFTIPIFYFQPSGLMIDLLKAEQRTGAPKYLEMEEAPFFETCRRMNLHAASVVAGSDRYDLRQGQLHHDWLGDPDPAVKLAVKAAIAAVAR